MRYLLLILLLTLPGVSNAYVYFNYNHVKSLCSGEIVFAAYPDPGDGDWPTIHYLPFDGPWEEVNGGVNNIIWSGLNFPVPGQVYPGFLKFCYFHSCYIEGNQAFLKMNCFMPPPPGVGYDTERVEMQLEADTSP